MNTEEVASNLVDLCGKREWMKAIESLYAKDIVSMEPRSMENMPAEMRGLDQVRGKTQWFIDNHEIHDSKVGGPFVAGDKFVVRFDIDVTDKASKKRMQMSEVGIYTVKDGKIIREEFLPHAQSEG
jgi:SnoaL-like domain